MNFIEICKQRCSVRSYTNQPVSSDDLDYLLEAARLAPSAVNFQPWIFIVVREEANRLKIQESYNREWFKSAPLYIVICGDHQQAWKRKSDGKDHCDIDISIAVEHICLAATERGLGTCWVCNFDEKALSAALTLPAHIEPIVILPVGHPNPEALCLETVKVRKPLQEIIRWEKF
jgi:Nitroreductase